jgi:prepilin-type processing-associated H-X9-DG protein
VPNSKAPLSYVVNGGVSDGVVGATPKTQMDFVENGLFFDEYTPQQYGTMKRTAPIDLSYLSSHDGTSKTILLGENMDALDWYFSTLPAPAVPPEPQPRQPGPAGSPVGQSWWNAMTWMQPDQAPPAWGTKQDALVTAGGTVNLLGKPAELGAPKKDQFYGRPFSEHSGSGFHIAFADGRVQFMTSDIEYRIYCLLMSPDSANAKYTSGTDQTGYPTSAPVGTTIKYPTKWYQGQNVNNPLLTITDGDYNP